MEALVISKRIVSLLNSGKPVEDSTETQYYLAVGIMVGKILVCSYIKHSEDDLVVLRNLKMGLLGLGYTDFDCLAYSQAGLLIALFQTLAVLVVF